MESCLKIMKEHQKHLTSHIRIRSLISALSLCNETIYKSTWDRKWNIITFVQATKKSREKQELFHSDQDNISFPFQDENTAKKCYATIMETN